jgi:hypothetical protein
VLGFGLSDGRSSEFGPGSQAGANQHIRIEVRPGTQAHDFCSSHTIGPGQVVSFSGPIRIDCHPPPLPPPFLGARTESGRYPAAFFQ